MHPTDHHATDAGGPPSGGLTGKGGYLLLSLAVVLLDQISKGVVEAGIPLLGRREVIPGLLDLVHVRNRGVAFGLFASQGSAPSGTLVLILLGLVALGVVGVYLWHTPRSDRLLLTSLGLIIGGAIGNLVDRIGSGAVTDFVDFYVGSYHWHTFNIADSAITVGIVLMLVDFLLPIGRRRPSADRSSAETGAGAETAPDSAGAAGEAG